MDSFLQLYSQIQNAIFHSDRIPDVIVAIFIAVIFGIVMQKPVVPPLWRVWSFLFGGIGAKMDKPERAPADLMFRGFLFTIFMGAIGYLIGQAAFYGVRVFVTIDIVQSLLLALMMSAGGLWICVFKVYNHLKTGKKSDGTYYALAQMTRTDLNSVDNFGIARQCLGILVKSFDKTIVALSIWYLVGGIVAAILYSVLAFGVWRFGRLGLGKGFANTVLFAEKLAGIIPSLITGLTLVIASILTPQAGIARSIGAIFKISNKAPYEQGGLPLSVLSWAFNVSLGGAVKDLDGHSLKGDWIGPDKASAKVSPDMLRGGLFIVAAAHLIFIALLLGAYIASGLSGAEVITDPAL